MKTVFDFTNAELKTYIGSIMSELYISWIDVKSYKYKLELLQSLLELLIGRDGLDKDDLSHYRHDLEVVNKEISETDEGEEPNGGIIKKECYLYGYVSKAGLTEDVKKLCRL